MYVTIMYYVICVTKKYALPTQVVKVPICLRIFFTNTNFSFFLCLIIIDGLICYYVFRDDICLQQINYKNILLLT